MPSTASRPQEPVEANYNDFVRGVQGLKMVLAGLRDLTGNVSQGRDLTAAGSPCPEFGQALALFSQRVKFAIEDIDDISIPLDSSPWFRHCVAVNIESFLRFFAMFDNAIEDMAVILESLASSEDFLVDSSTSFIRQMNTTITTKIAQFAGAAQISTNGQFTFVPRSDFLRELAQQVLAGNNANNANANGA
jgi:hypothetical protein